MIKNRIAIIGGGGMGVCTALELARLGYHVQLIEASEELIKKASYANEGKIHVGLVYALDTKLKTARTMIEGALHFVSYLKRWIDLNPEDLLSTPFYYLNHVNSLLHKDQLRRHYRSCQKLFKEAVAHYGQKYLDLFENLTVESVNPGSFSLDFFNRDLVESLYKTNEYAVDVRRIASLLRSAVEQNNKVSIFLNTKVLQIKKAKNFQLILTNNGDERIESFDIVINAAWDGRLELDQQLGVVPAHPWSYRYKLATRIISEFHKEEIPSVTIVQGPFGDVVNFKDQGMYFSWYPIGRMAWSEDLRPPDWDKQFTRAMRLKKSQQSLRELGKIIPSLHNIDIANGWMDPVGGIIYALGNNEVDWIRSRLHARNNIGIQSFGNYHTINTGKYTSIPRLAVKQAERIVS